MTEPFTTHCDITRFENRPALDQQLSDEIAQRLRSRLQKSEYASLAVSGGRTPIGLFEALSQQPLDWSRVIITLVDERWVEPDAADSNERLVRNHLLQNQASQARFIGLKTPAASAETGQAECQLRLSQLPARMDVAVLGMGEDGHTASFFPGAQALSQALDLESGMDCLSLTPPAAPHDRMTLSLSRVLRCDQLYLHLCGDAKLPVLAQAQQAGPTAEMPVRALLRQNHAPLAIYWAP
ncbi:6-phosphogluconolactonase [Aestuariirhabdus sp. Z084]|uniref:6-phosphogluconolactonase n=1 Tax=Aestuariirhabdus haliotis TaxID=2918751 RepID=UPI0020C18421|nr:6-phosphogluconolactonase [Aestuariirhabdus haliotis]MCL6417073.1 6-phosphogluconolactonase [Aestuariirhabdus haliotis]